MDAYLHQPAPGPAPESEQSFDPESPEFIAACLAAVAPSPSQQRTHSADRLAADAKGDVDHALAPARHINGTQESQDPIPELEAHVEQLRVALSVAESQIHANSTTARENSMHRHAWASEREADTLALNEARHREGEATKELQRVHAELTELRMVHAQTAAGLKSELQEARQEARQDRKTLTKAMKTIADHESTIEQLRQALAGAEAQIDSNSQALQESEAIRSAMLSEHEADTQALGEARRREGEATKGLQRVQAELTKLRTIHAQTTTTLKSQTQTARQDRKAVGRAMRTISDHESTIEQVRQSLALRDREISELQRHLLKVEQERIADAATFLDSLKLQES